eukprot:scaffold27151_cov163-Isochrysis_galbana.AAC.1
MGEDAHTNIERKQHISGPPASYRLRQHLLRRTEALPPGKRGVGRGCCQFRRAQALPPLPLFVAHGGEALVPEIADTKS